MIARSTLMGVLQAFEWPDAMVEPEHVRIGQHGGAFVCGLRLGERFVQAHAPSPEGAVRYAITGWAVAMAQEQGLDRAVADAVEVQARARLAN